MTGETTFSRADGLLCQLRVVDGELVMDLDAEPGYGSAMRHAAEVLRAAADVAETRQDALTTLRPSGFARQHIM
jgi:hypothetical protein